MSRSDILFQSVQDFYREPSNSQVLDDILDKKNGVSLRNLEWFVTNYSKLKNTTFTTKDGKQFAVHCSYKSTLGGYSKKLFDPFCRTQKVSFMLTHNNKTINTTVAQLNFIRWCIKNNIIDYIKDNQSSLKKDYN